MFGDDDPALWTDRAIVERQLGRGMRVEHCGLIDVIAFARERGVDGEASAGSTVYVVEPHGNAVYADAHLPFEPTAWSLDVAPGYPNDERQELLAFSGSGSVAAVEIGKHAFAWRVPGVLAGVLMAVLLYLLARLLFRRRTVGVLAAVFVGLDGMLFVQSRIGMNDAYVGLFIVAAYLLFAGLWLGRWRSRRAFASPIETSATVTKATTRRPADAERIGPTTSAAPPADQATTSAELFTSGRFNGIAGMVPAAKPTTR